MKLQVVFENRIINYEVKLMKNNRGLKTRTTISSTIKNELSEKLKNLSEETKVPISKLLDEAIEYLLKERERI